MFSFNLTLKYKIHKKIWYSKQEQKRNTDRTLEQHNESVKICKYEMQTWRIVISSTNKATATDRTTTATENLALSYKRRRCLFRGQ